MARFLLSRLAQFPLILAAIYLVTFLLAWVAPGDPFGAQSEKVNPERVQALRERYNVDSSWSFLTTYPVNLLRGEFGPSFTQRGRNVGDIIEQTLPVSMAIGTLSIIIATAFGIGIGTLAAVKRGGVLDSLSLTIALFGVSVPSFVAATLFLSVFANQLEWFPLGGWPDVEGAGLSNPDAYVDLPRDQYDPVTQQWNLTLGQWLNVFPRTLPDYLQYMTLPAIALSLLPMAYITRLTRVSMIDVLGSDYVRTARAKGLAKTTVIFKHCLRNALLPVLSFLGPATASVLVGSFVVEKIFQIPGLGKFFVESVQFRDQPMILGTVMVYSVLLLTLNLVVDVLYSVIDPRISVDGGAS